MEVEGYIKEVLPLEEGEGKNGHWSRQTFIIETGGAYNNDIAFQVFNQKLDLNSLKIKERVTISFNLISNLYNGKYYTNATAYKILRHSVASVQSVQNQAPAPPAPPAEQPLASPPPQSSDLPF